MNNKKLVVTNLKKSFTGDKNNPVEAIKDISFDLYSGEILGVIGTSGCGKSTLLNILAGLLDKDAGSIEWGNSESTISYMLQSDALLPWKSVYENALLGVNIKKMRNQESEKHVNELLNKYGLKDFKNSRPDALSGGMRQRCALIRSLAIKPDVLLLDEPFSALDYYTRLTISEDVHKIIKETNTSTIIITHDVGEALALCDRIIVLSSRPSIVKKIYTPNFADNLSLMERRKSKEYTDLFEKIWSDLDVKI